MLFSLQVVFLLLYLSFLLLLLASSYIPASPCALFYSLPHVWKRTCNRLSNKVRPHSEHHHDPILANILLEEPTFGRHLTPIASMSP